MKMKEQNLIIIVALVCSFDLLTNIIKRNNDCSMKSIFCVSFIKNIAIFVIKYKTDRQMKGMDRQKLYWNPKFSVFPSTRDAGS